MKHHNIGFDILELEKNSYHIIVKANIGKRRISLVIDTGASHTCFDLKYIDSLKQDVEVVDNEMPGMGIGTSTLMSKTSLIRNFRIGKLEIPEYHIVLLDLEHINGAYKMLGLPRVHGILGSDFLFLYSAVIDYQKGEMTLWEKD